jgi:hypothetical protein
MLHSSHDINETPKGMKAGVTDHAISHLRPRNKIEDIQCSTAEIKRQS